MMKIIYIYIYNNSNIPQYTSYKIGTLNKLFHLKLRLMVSHGFFLSLAD